MPTKQFRLGRKWTGHLSGCPGIPGTKTLPILYIASVPSVHKSTHGSDIHIFPFFTSLHLVLAEQCMCYYTLSMCSNHCLNINRHSTVNDHLPCATTPCILSDNLISEFSILKYCWATSQYFPIPWDKATENTPNIYLELKNKGCA